MGPLTGWRGIVWLLRGFGRVAGMMDAEVLRRCLTRSVGHLHGAGASHCIVGVNLLHAGIVYDGIFYSSDPILWGCDCTIISFRFFSNLINIPHASNTSIQYPSRTTQSGYLKSLSSLLSNTEDAKFLLNSITM